MFEKICIVTRYGSMLARDIANIVSGILRSKGAKIYTIKPLSLDSSIILDDELHLRGEGIELVIAIGGDGTTLRAIRWIDGYAPVFSIRIKGSRGVLADIDTDTIHEAIDMIYTNKFYIEERNRIYVRNNKINSIPGLNEVMLIKASNQVTPTFTLMLDDYITNQRMDGLIIATATGSSGYSYSFGGPILHESSDHLIITPIASIDRFPIIVMPYKEIKISASDSCNILVDGEYSMSISKDEIVSIKRYHNNAKLLRIKKRGLMHIERLGY